MVIGGGDIAFDGAVSLRRRGWEVEVLVRGATPRALGLLSRRVQALGVRVGVRSRVDRVEPAEGGLRLIGADGDGPRAWSADRLLLAVGREPRLPPVVDRRDGEPGRPLVFPDDAGTLPRLILAGDVARDRDRQAAIAAGDGVAAAMALARELAEESPE